jgi:hypothetical protein
MKPYFGLYGKAAVIAARACRKKKSCCPESEWKKAVAKLSSSKSTQEKSCPRDAFLGLCSAGSVVGIPAGNYLKRGIINAGYALTALRLLRAKPLLGNSISIKALWLKVIHPAAILHNQQMNVVLALWHAKLLK